jgi:hypothetical protein
MTNTLIDKINFDDGTLLSTTLSSANSGLLTQVYTSLIATQQQFSLTKVDAGIAVKISAYQQRMVNQAKYINANIIPSFIFALADISNFSALMDALNTEMSKSNEELLAQVKDVAVEVTALADLAQTYDISVSALQTKMSVVSNSMLPLMEQYGQTLAELEKLSEKDIESITAEIDTLNKATAENIAGIIAGGKKAGEGVTDIGRGIISVINIAEKDKAKVDDKDKKDKAKVDDKDKKEKVAPEDGDETSKYMISGLTSISGGVAGASKSAEDLKANNVKLAAEYQRLAQANAILSVAKSVDAQNVLFVGSNTTFSTNVKELSSSWQSIFTSFQSNVTVISDISSVEDIQRLKVDLGHSNQKWQILNDQINYIKQSFIGSSSLPDAN